MAMRRFVASSLGTIVVLICAACSGSGSTGAVPAFPTQAPGHKPQAALKFRFSIPRRKHEPRQSRYLSPSTKSIAITAFDATHTHKLAQTSLNATPGTGGCSRLEASGTFTCALSIAVPAGDDTFDVASYDELGATGNKLSAITAFPFDVLAGAANHIAMTLGGIPATLDIALVGHSAFAAGTALSGFQLGGIGPGAAQQLQLTAKDVDGNIIVDPGAPSFTLTSNEPSKISIVPVAGSSGGFSVTPVAETNALTAPDPSTAITLTARATAAGTGSAPVTATATVQNDAVTYVGNYDKNVQGYAPWSSSPIVTIGMIPDPQYLSVAVDASGNVYATNYVAGTISEFPPGVETPIRTITGLTSLGNLLVDKAGDIFVVEIGTDVKEFTIASGNTPSRTLSSTTSPSGIHDPHSIALDSAGNLYVNNELPSPSIGVAIFAPGTTTTPTATFFDGMSQPIGVALDGAGVVYVVNYSGNDVTEYKPPFSNTSTVAATYGGGATLSGPQNLTVDASGDVYVSNGNGQVLEFTAASPVTPVRTFTNGNSSVPTSLTTDPLQNLYVPWNAPPPGSVDIFAPGSSMTAFNSLVGGAESPEAVAVWP
jgi:hypothetical protein